MKIVFTGGGTGGHIFPIISIIRELKKIYPYENLKLYYIGPKDKFSEFLFQNEQVKVKTIFTGKIRRYLNFVSFFQNIFDIFIKIPLGIIQSFFILIFLWPDLIFAKGGYGSIPVVLVGKMLFRTIFIHESDIAPGKTNKIIAKFAKEIFTAFPETKFYQEQEKIICVGNPLRAELLSADNSKEKGKKLFNIESSKPVIFIMGGSQGAQKINDRVLEVLPAFLKDFEIIHQCGRKNYAQIKKEFEIILKKEEQARYHLYSFLNEEQLREAYNVCDFIISRAGSGSIFEIAAVGKPSILVPIAGSAQNHQYLNAYYYQKIGACEVIEEANFKPHFLLERIKYFFANPLLLEEMKKNAKAFAKPEAAKIIATYIVEFLTRK